MVNQKDLLDRLSDYPDMEWYIAMETDMFLSKPISDLDKIEVEKLIELRVFNDAYEIKAIRGSLGDEFQWRDSKGIAASEEGESVWSQSSNHFLDIDTKKGAASHEGFVDVFATGGGEYGLPSEKVKQIEIENYYRTDNKGFFKPFDFRIVRFF